MKISISDISPGILKIHQDFEDKFKEFSKSTLEEQRELLDTMYITGSRVIPVDLLENKVITWNNMNVPIRVYQSSSTDKLPILVYFHGGGWVLGSLESQDRLCRLITSKFPCVVISVGYRLAPEYKFPAGINDCVAVLDWLVNGGAKINWDLRKIVCSGDSAGGNLAIVVPNIFNKKYKEKGQQIYYSVPIYPVTDLVNYNTQSYKNFGEGYFLDELEMIWYGKKYLNNEEDALNPNASPILATDFTYYSPTTVITSGYDVLLDEGVEFAKKLKNNGIQSNLVNFEDMTHGFLRFADHDEISRINIDKVADIIISKW